MGKEEYELMIVHGDPKLTGGIHECWNKCFTMEDPRYTEYFFNNLYKPEYGYALVEEGAVISTICRIPHAIMFNGRILQASMLLGAATLPDYRNRGCMHQMMDTVIDACEHSELITFIQAYRPDLYIPWGFQMVEDRMDYTVTRADVKRITNYGCAYEPSPIDLLKVYSAYIRRFNGFYARDLDYFVKLKKEIQAQGGKIVAYYNGKDQIQGYATILIQGREAKVEELVYLDAMSLTKLVNAALQERPTVHLWVSDAENLGVMFPHAPVSREGFTMARLNDAALFSRLFGTEVTDARSAFAISKKPLNMNEAA